MRDIIFSSVVGSHHYGLATDKSDMDIRKFAMPSFEDFFNNTFTLDKKEADGVDEVIYDIRKLPMYFFNSNVSMLDILFSKEILVGDNKAYKCFTHFLINNREEIAKMNLKKLYHSVMGMYFKNWKLISVMNEQNKYLFDKFGYNTKLLVACYRITNVLQAAYRNEPIEPAIRLSTEKFHSMAERMLNGIYTFEEADNALTTTDSILKSYKDFFEAQPVNEKIYAELIDKTETFVKLSFTRKMLDEILFKEGGVKND